MLFLQGFLSTGMFFFLSNAKPRKRLSRQRPHSRILSIYVLLNVLLQFSVHVSFLFYSYWVAEKIMDPADKQLPDTDFKPNLVNTVSYLANTIIMVGCSWGFPGPLGFSETGESRGAAFP